MPFNDNIYIRNDTYLVVFLEGLLQTLEAPVIVNNAAVTKEKISSFKNLPSGWHYGEGIAPTHAMIDVAHDWHNRITGLGFAVTNAFPGVTGEIMISGRNGERDVEIILEADGTISFEYDKNDEAVVSIERGDAAEVDAALNRAAGELWNTSGLFINDILSPTKIVSPAWHSEITAVAHRLFYMNAFKWQVDPFADTSEPTTPTLSESPQSFGFWTDHPKVGKHQFLLPVE